MNNPLLEMAREQDNQATWEDDIVGGAVFLSRARILRAAAAVILQMQALRDDIREQKIFWPAEVDFAIEALDAYEAACQERVNE